MIGKSAVIKVQANARIFIVEDSKERIRWFQEKLGDKIVGLTASPRLAIDMLFHLDPFSLNAVFLDHDLGPNPQTCDTSIEVAKWLADYTRIDPTWSERVIIHSYNEPGQKRLKAYLRQSAILPFGSFNFEIQKAS